MRHHDIAVSRYRGIAAVGACSLINACSCCAWKLDIHPDLARFCPFSSYRQDRTGGGQEVDKRQEAADPAPTALPCGPWTSTLHWISECHRHLMQAGAYERARRGRTRPRAGPVLGPPGPHSGRSQVIRQSKRRYKPCRACVQSSTRETQDTQTSSHAS